MFTTFIITLYSILVNSLISIALITIYICLTPEFVSSAKIFLWALGLEYMTAQQTCPFGCLRSSSNLVSPCVHGWLHDLPHKTPVFSIPVTSVVTSLFTRARNLEVILGSSFFSHHISNSLPDLMDFYFSSISGLYLPLSIFTITFLIQTTTSCQPNPSTCTWSSSFLQCSLTHVSKNKSTTSFSLLKTIQYLVRTSD